MAIELAGEKSGPVSTGPILSTEENRLTNRLNLVRNAIEAQIRQDASQLTAAGRSLTRLSITTLTKMECDLMLQLKVIRSGQAGGAFPYDQKVTVVISE